MENKSMIQELQRQKLFSADVAEIMKVRALSGTPKAFVRTYGCQQNVADGEKIKGMLAEMGFEFTEEEIEADFIIFNTCAIREHAEDRVYGNIGALKNIKRKHPSVMIAVCGCMMEQEHVAERIKKSFPFVNIVFGTHVIHKLPEMIYTSIVDSKRIFVRGNETKEIYEGLPVRRDGKSRAWVTVMYGCDNFCSYCIVPYVRGREKSRKSEDIIREFKSLVEDGYKEITLLGQNVNSYGKKTEGCISFAELLDKVSSLDGEYWVRFMTSHPKDVSDELIEVIKKNDKVAKHFHLPVQSGSNRILKLMNRRYTKESYLEIVRKLREAVPDITLTTDIIVGFPGETEEDFAETLDIVGKVGFDSIYSFIYSKRVGTPAEKMEDPITYEQKTERFARLMDLHHEKITAINKGYVGKTIKVLCETPDGDEICEFAGRCTGNKLIKFTAPKGSKLYGRFVDVTITKSGDVQLYGEIVDN